jgi:hypothetical protein
MPLSVPYFDVTLGQENSSGIALPGGQFPFGGGAHLRVTTELEGAELNGIYSLQNRRRLRLELLTGFRYLALHERLEFSTSSPALNLPNSLFRTLDEFRTSNDFYGGQLGARAELCWGCWSVQAAGKVAVGVNHQVTRIKGVLLTNDFTNQQVLQLFQGGYFALPTNIGTFDRDEFCVVPELNLSLAWQPDDHFRLFVGYTFLYLDNVARPGDQIDRSLNPSQAPAINGNPGLQPFGPARPVFLGRDADVWVSGLSVGLEVRY